MLVWFEWGCFCFFFVPLFFLGHHWPEISFEGSSWQCCSWCVFPAVFVVVPLPQHGLVLLPGFFVADQACVVVQGCVVRVLLFLLPGLLRLVLFSSL